MEFFSIAEENNRICYPQGWFLGEDQEGRRSRVKMICGFTKEEV